MVRKRNTSWGGLFPQCERYFRRKATPCTSLS